MKESRSSMDANYYKILEVPLEAGKAEIKRAYRRKAKQWHPDLNGAPDANRMFQQVGQAYDVLLDNKRRARYDLALKYYGSFRFDTANRNRQAHRDNKYREKSARYYAILFHKRERRRKAVEKVRKVLFWCMIFFGCYAMFQSFLYFGKEGAAAFRNGVSGIIISAAYLFLWIIIWKRRARQTKLFNEDLQE